jgi:hypothetical protein
MEEWLKLNFDIYENDFKMMLENNCSLNEVTFSDAEKLVDFLRKIGCDKRLIRNTIMSNALVLSRLVPDLEKLVAKLRQIGLTDIVDLLDANPYILNLDAYEIDDYIKKKEESGESFEDIVAALESEPALFLEI